MAYTKYKDIPHRREPLGGRDHIQHIENGLVKAYEEGVGVGGGTAAPPSPFDEVVTYAARDRFGSDNGTALTAHGPDVGGGWTAYASAPVIQDKAVVGGAIRAVAVIPSVGADVQVTGQFVLGATDGAGIIVRATDNANFWFAWIEMSAKQLRLYEVTAGTTAIRAQLGLPAIAAGQRVTMQVTALGQRLVAEVLGHGTLQFDNTTQAGSGIGFRMGPTSSGHRLTDFAATPYAPATIATLPTLTATNAASPLILPEMYGDTQGTHPDVVDFGTAWNGYRYWMAWTPHTGSNTAYENPSITVSNNGTTWTTPPGLTNPVIPPPGAGYNSDPDLTYHDGVLYLMYRSSGGGTNERIWVTESTNGTTWSTPTVVWSGTTANNLVSPAVVYRRGQWHMWSVSTGTVDRWRIEYRTAPSIYGPWSSPRHVMINYPAPKTDMWHLDVIDRKSKLVMVASSSDRNAAGSGANGDLYYAESLDGVHWTMAPTPFLARSESGWDDDKLYRSVLLPSGTGYVLYYSALGTSGKWHVGRTTVAVS